MHKVVAPRDWVWDGGRPSLDLINTYRNRKTGGWELLRDPADLADWLGGVGPVSAEHLVAARALREAVDRCLIAASAEDLSLINAWALLRRAPVVQLASDLSVVRLPPPDPVEAALAEIACDAVVLLGEDRSLVRVCASPTCGLRFTDRSNAGKRQWCSMRRCGNREKVRLHRARQKES